MTGQRHLQRGSTAPWCAFRARRPCMSAAGLPTHVASPSHNFPICHPFVQFRLPLTLLFKSPFNVYPTDASVGAGCRLSRGLNRRQWSRAYVQQSGVERMQTPIPTVNFVASRDGTGMR